MPDIRFPNLDVEQAAADINRAVKDAAYVAVGLGVLGFQRAQVQRVELTRQLSDLARAVDDAVAPVRAQIESGELTRQLSDLARTVDDAVAPVRAQWDGQLDRLEEVLPPAAREAVQTVRAAASTQEQAIRSAIGLD